MNQEQAKAVFAGGCFWCMESSFEFLDGVSAVLSGYTGGHVANPTYEQVASGTTGHREAIEVVYDPARVSYERLLKTFWQNVDPLDEAGQFVDKGHQYTSAIYVSNDTERALAEDSKRKIEERLGHKAVTEILPAAVFYPAEEYHQDFYKKSPERYERYSTGSGRKERLKALWGDDAPDGH